MSKKARILFFLPSFSGGGAERTVLNILKNYDRELVDIKVCLLDFTGDYSAFVPDNSILNHQDKGRFFVAKASNPLYSLYKFVSFMLPTQYRAIRSFQPDIIMTITESMNYMSIFWKVLGITRDMIWVVRSGNNILAEAMSKGFLFGHILKSFLKKAYPKADHIITLSNGAKSQILSRYSIKESKVSVIANPVDLEKITSLNKASTKHSYRYILGVGRLAPQKNFKLLIEAYNQSIAPIKGIHLVILGVGSERQKLMHRATELGIEALVHFEGFQENPYSYMKNAEAFILSSHWEGFGHVLVEAMACECPVISTDCDFGPNEILDRGRYGKLVAVNDMNLMSEEINTVITLEEKKRNEVIQKAKDRAQDFSIEKIVRTYEHLFSTLSGAK
jgi:glycosyltransferase involved in cell wall biosynthesis